MIANVIDMLVDPEFLETNGSTNFVLRADLLCYDGYFEGKKISISAYRPDVHPVFPQTSFEDLHDFFTSNANIPDYRKMFKPRVIIHDVFFNYSTNITIFEAHVNLSINHKNIAYTISHEPTDELFDKALDIFHINAKKISGMSLVSYMDATNIFIYSSTVNDIPSLSISPNVITNGIHINNITLTLDKCHIYYAIGMRELTHPEYEEFACLDKIPDVSANIDLSDWDVEYN